MVVGAVGEGVVVDQHRHFGRATLAGAGPGDGGDERVRTQLIERPGLGVGLGSLGGDSRIQRRRDAGVGFGVQREMGVAQPGLAVGPATQGPLPADPFPPAQSVVVRELPGEIANVPLEPIDRRIRCRLHEFGRLLHQLRTHPVVDLSGDTGDDVDVSSSHHPSSERLVQLGHRRTHLSASRHRPRLARRPMSITTDDGRVDPSGEGRVECVEPGTDLSRLDDQPGDVGLRTPGRIGCGQHSHRSDDGVRVHATIIRTSCSIMSRVIDV